MNRTSPTMASTARLRLITLVTLLALALAALPVPAAYAATITINDRASCSAAGGGYEALSFGTACMFNSNYTLATGNTLVLAASSTLNQVYFFADLTINGTLQIQRGLAVLAPDDPNSTFTNNGTIELDDLMRFRQGSHLNGARGIINIGRYGTINLGPNVGFTNNGVIRITCEGRIGGGTYSGTPPEYSDCTGPVTDSTSPVITPEVTGTLGNNGWYTSNVTVSWTVTDAESAVTSQSGCEATTVSSDTAGQTLTCAATSAGGTGSASVTIKRDATAPTLAPTVSPNPVLLNGSATATPNASDGRSGVASQSCGPIATSSVGSQSVSCTATDNAGNTATANASYSVTYAFSGFSSPVDAAPVLNSAKAGQTIPLKWRLTDANGMPVTNLTTVQVRVTSLNCGSSTTVDAVEEYATGESGLKNLGNGYYQFNWKSPKSYAGLCKTLSLNLGEGSTALF